MSQRINQNAFPNTLHTSDNTIVVDAEKSSSVFKFREFWEYRELLYFLVWRQVIGRYKQTIIGIIWVIVQLLVSVAIMIPVFNVFLNIDSGDTPYPIFLLSAMIFWRYFAGSLTLAGESLVSNAHMISKIYFPRVLIPSSACISPLIDSLLTLSVLLFVMPFFGIYPSLRIVLIPVLLVLTFLTVLSVSLWLSFLNVRYRDVGQVILVIVQIWMYLVTILYPIERVDASVQPLHSIYPMVVVVEGAR